MKILYLLREVQNYAIVAQKPFDQNHDERIQGRLALNREDELQGLLTLFQDHKDYLLTLALYAKERT